MKQLYTIGHSTYPAEHFAELLKCFEVDCILDVRSVPFSRHVPQYNRDELKAFLKQNGIEYHPMGKWFGARQPDMQFYSEEGYLDFEKFRESSLFIQGLESVKRGLDQFNIALMCSEKDPIDCHRAIMVGRGFELDGTDVKHILHDFSSITQAELNARLLDRYFPNRNQISIFDLGGEKTDEEYLVDAYRIRNSEIGYRPIEG